MLTTDALTAQDRRDIETLWDFHVVRSIACQADVMVVLGSHDLRVADHAASLFLTERMAPLVVATGGAGKITGKEWRKSEAELYATRMIELGVPADKILIENQAENTGDNFLLSKRLLEGKRLHPTTGVIVSKPYMARRALATAMRRWPDVRWSTQPPSTSIWEYPTPDTPLDRMINLMVGDTQRLWIYADKGFQTPVKMPSRVRQAYERLVHRGYDEFIIT